MTTASSQNVTALARESALSLGHLVGAGLRIGLAAAWPLLQRELFAKRESD